MQISDISNEQITDAYSGRHGCACGCRGNWRDSGPGKARIIATMRKAAAADPSAVKVEANEIRGGIVVWYETETRLYILHATGVSMPEPQPQPLSFAGKPVRAPLAQALHHALPAQPAAAPEHTCCMACRTGNYSGVPLRDMDGCMYTCSCECEACNLEYQAAYDAERGAQ